MQQSLHQSLRLLCRHHCRRRLYSAAATQPKQTSDSTGHGDNVPSSSRQVENASSSTKAEKKTNSKKANARPVVPLPVSDGLRLGSRTESYLASLRAEGKEPSLDDLLRLKPSRKPPRPDSSGYASAYHDLLDRISLSFSKKQLYHFVRELGLGLANGKERKKTEYVEAIMGEWGWPSLKDIEKKKKEASEITVQSEPECPSSLDIAYGWLLAFPVSACELFLLLGKGMLSDSIRYSY